MERFKETIAEVEGYPSPQQTRDHEATLIMEEYLIREAAHEQEWHPWRDEIPPFDINSLSHPVVAHTWSMENIQPWQPLPVSGVFELDNIEIEAAALMGVSGLNFTEVSFVYTPADPLITPVDQHGTPGIDTSDTEEE